MTRQRPYRISDGNGGHFWDWKNIKESIIAGIILAIIISISSTVLNRVFNTRRLEATMEKVEKYSIRSLQMNEIQNKQINENTKTIYNKWFPGVPAPQICWPEIEMK